MNHSQTNWGRSILPVPMSSRNSFQDKIAVLKQCIGKNLSKMSMPVVINEPLSLLQRLCESMEYYYLLDYADLCDDPVKRMEYVASFAVAATSPTSERIWKPFNPILGETYELVRDDLGFRVIAEKVSHDPSVSAFYADSAHFIFSGYVHPKLSIWLKCVEAKPEGIQTVQLREHNETYTWTGVTCRVKNILIGTPQIEQDGVMEITCHSNGYCALLSFHKDCNRVDGFVVDEQKTQLRFLYGKWSSFLRTADVKFFETYIREKEEQLLTPHSSEICVAVDGGEINPTVNLNAPLLVTTEETHESAKESISQNLTNKEEVDNLLPNLLWSANKRPEYSSEYYNFSSFTMALNELQEGMESKLPPTDSRRRLDIRSLEEGDIDEAETEKCRLEEKQRTVLKKEKKENSWEPLWFEQQQHSHIESQIVWAFKGNYWERNFSCSPDIF